MGSIVRCLLKERVWRRMAQLQLQGLQGSPHPCWVPERQLGSGVSGTVHCHVIYLADVGAVPVRACWLYDWHVGDVDVTFRCGWEQRGLPL